MVSKIKYPVELDDSIFNELKKVWNSFKNVNIIYPKKRISVKKSKALIRFLLLKSPDDFAFTLLDFLVQNEYCSENDLKKIFRIGDWAIKISVCLCPNLSLGLLNKCLASKDLQVFEHTLFRFGRKDHFKKYLLTAKER
jgi:hypothetical protein